MHLILLRDTRWHCGQRSNPWSRFAACCNISVAKRHTMLIAWRTFFLKILRNFLLLIPIRKAVTVTSSNIALYWLPVRYSC